MIWWAAQWNLRLQHICDTLATFVPHKCLLVVLCSVSLEVVYVYILGLETHVYQHVACLVCTPCLCKLSRSMSNHLQDSSYNREMVTWTTDQQLPGIR